MKWTIIADIYLHTMEYLSKVINDIICKVE